MSTFMHKFGRSKNVAKRVSKKYLEEALYKRLFKDGGSELSIRQNLNTFLKSRKRVYKWEADRSLKILRDRQRYSPALKVNYHLCAVCVSSFLFEIFAISDIYIYIYIDRA